MMYTRAHLRPSEKEDLLEWLFRGDSPNQPPATVIHPIGAVLFDGLIAVLYALNSGGEKVQGWSWASLLH